MKKLTALIASVFCAAALYADANILVVDIAQVHTSYYKTKIAQDALNVSLEPTNAEIKRLETEHNKILEEAQEVEKKLSNSALTDDAKKEIVQKELAPKAQKMNEIKAQLQNLVNNTRNEVAKQRNETLALHRQEILAEIKKIAEAKKASFVVEKQVCHFAISSADITEEVIAALNAKAPKN